MNSERNPSAPWLVPVLVGLTAACAGLGAGWYLRGSTHAPEVAARVLEAQESNAATREQLEALRQEILAQLSRLGRTSPEVASPAAASAGSTVLELTRRIDEIDGRIALLSAGSRPAFSGRAWASMRGRGCESIEKIGQRIVDWHKRAQKNEGGEDECALLTRDHHLWMIEDVVRTYGPPERLTSSNGILLYYGRFPLENVDAPCFVFFRIEQGFVTEVGFDCISDW